MGAATNYYQFFKASWLKEDDKIRIEDTEKQNFFSFISLIDPSDELKENIEARKELEIASRPLSKLGLHFDLHFNMHMKELTEKDFFIHHFGKNANGKNQFAIVSKYDYVPIFKLHDSATTLFQELVEHKDSWLLLSFSFKGNEIIDENDFTFRMKKYKNREDLVGEEFEIRNGEISEFSYSGSDYPIIGMISEINPSSPLAYYYTKALLIDIGNGNKVYQGLKSEEDKVYFNGENVPIIFKTLNSIKTDRVALQLYPNTDYNFKERMVFIKIIVSNQPIEIYDDVQEINYTKNWTVFTFPIKIVEKNPENLIKVTLSSSSEKLQKSVLWVYDDPYNDGNESIIEKLVKNNYTVDHVLDTETALSNLQTTDYELIISDIGRAKGAEAGMKFLVKFKELNNNTPFVFYTTANNVKKYEKEAIELGVYAIKTGSWEEMSEYFLYFLKKKNQLVKFNEKWVLVKGTFDEKYTEKEKLMSISLGKYLANNGYGLIAGGSVGIESVVLKSFISKLNETQINERVKRIIANGQNQKDVLGSLTKIPNLNDLNNIILEIADAVILVGGRGGTFITYKAAIEKGIPVLPIPNTEGDAKDAYTHLLNRGAFFNDKYIKQLHKLNLKIDNEEAADLISSNIGKIFEEILFSNLFQKEVLWLNDDPFDYGNKLIIKYLKSKNVLVTYVLNSDNAFEKLKAKRYDLIISEINRDNDSEAGIKFLDELKKLDKDIPFVFCTTNEKVKNYEKEALEKGANAVKTGNWENLSEYFLDFLHNKKSQPILNSFKYKWVLIAGTGNEMFSEKERIMCISLGKYLAQNGYGVKCGGWPGVDEEISRSFSEFLITKKVDPAERLVQVIDYRLGNSFKIFGEILQITGNSDWDKNALRNADALVMIGGQGGTFELYEKALSNNLTIIPIPATGGDSKKVFEIITKNNIKSSLNQSGAEINDLISNLDLEFETEKDANIISQEIINILNKLSPPSTIDENEFRGIVENLYKTNSIKEIDDLQKYRWGRISSKDNKTLTAHVEMGDIMEYFKVRLSIHDFYGKNTYAAIFLHDTFTEEIRYLKFENGKAECNLKMVYEAFTVGVYLDDGTSLELDLNDLIDIPKGFRHNDISEYFKNEVEKIYSNSKITIKDDLQKGRWGGLNSVNGIIMSASVKKSLIPKIFKVTIEVNSQEKIRILTGDIAFFIHDTFSSEIKYTKFVDGKAQLLLSAYEAFTVGAYLQDGTVLELDLQKQKGYPQNFYYKDI